MHIFIFVCSDELHLNAYILTTLWYRMKYIDIPNMLRLEVELKIRLYIYNFH